MFGLGRGRSFAGYGLRTPDAIYPQEAPGGRQGAAVPSFESWMGVLSDHPF